jgi:hypothetical protein
MKTTVKTRLAIACAIAALPAIAGAQTCFYENYNYQGAYYCTDATSGDTTAPVIDKISAVKVPAGYKVVLYQHPGFTGKTLELSGDTPNLSNLGFNNLTSSFQLVPTQSAPTPPKQVLFIGNSFFHGEFEPTQHFNAANVLDLNGTGYGGVPGIFKQLTVDAGLNYSATIEAVSGQSLQYHYQNKLPLIGSKAFDIVVMADYSTLDQSNPGNPTKLFTYSKLLEQYIHGGTNPHPNPNARVFLMATWARADQLYNTPGGHWYGQTVEQMANDLQNAYVQAAAQDPAIEAVIPVGEADARAVTEGVADRNPYDKVTDGFVKVWNVDNYHASAWASYLEALVLFGRITGVDPRTLSPDGTAPKGLGLTSMQASAAATIAWEQLSQAAR